jgi:hypothetical protein
MILSAVPNLLQKAITATQSSLELQLQVLLERVNVLTTAADRCIRTPGKPESEELYRMKKEEEEAEGEEGAKKSKNANAEKHHNISRKQIEMVLDELTTARQLEVYLRYLSQIRN